MIPMTAELAQICLEAEEIKLYSSSPDRQFSFMIRFSLVDENGRPYTSLKGVAAPKPHGQAAAQYQLRRSRAAERRRAEDERTFCLFTSLPASLAGAGPARKGRQTWPDYDGVWGFKFSDDGHKREISIYI